MGQVSIGGKTYDIYGEYSTDTPGETESAVTYFNGQLNTTAWDNASSTDQQKALVSATRIFDKQLWVSTPTDPDNQPLAWPRVGVADCDGNPIDDNEIPEDIILGSYEYALAILNDAAVQTEQSAGSNTKREKSRDKVGDLETERETEYFSPTNIRGSRNSEGRFPTQVQEYVRCYLSSGALSPACASSTEPVFPEDWTFNNEGLP